MKTLKDKVQKGYQLDKTMSFYDERDIKKTLLEFKEWLNQQHGKHYNKLIFEKIDELFGDL